MRATCSARARGFRPWTANARSGEVLIFLADRRNLRLTALCDGDIRAGIHGRAGRGPAVGGNRPALARPGAPCLVVVSSLQEIDGLFTDAAHQPVFLCDSARPAPGKHIFERFGFARTFERVSHDCLNQIEDPDCCRALALYPETQVLKELRLEYSDPPRRSLHGASLYAMRPLFEV